MVRRWNKSPLRFHRRKFYKFWYSGSRCSMILITKNFRGINSLTHPWQNRTAWEKIKANMKQTIHVSYTHWVTILTETLKVSGPLQLERSQYLQIRTHRCCAARILLFWATRQPKEWIPFFEQHGLVNGNILWQNLSLLEATRECRIWPISLLGWNNSGQLQRTTGCLQDSAGVYGRGSMPH